MIRRLMIILLGGAITLLGLNAMSLGKGVYYDTLQTYEKVTGSKIEKFHESPMLRTRVAAGELPPVEERLPKEPLVCDPFEEIGQYGGTLHGFAIHPNYWQDTEWLRRKDNLFLPSLDGKTIRPQIAKGYKISKDLKTFTIYLRKGLKWSDGTPFTADDILFYFNDEVGSDEITPVKPSDLIPGGKMVEVKKIDDYTVQFRFAVPNVAGFMMRISRDGGQNYMFDPKHYLRKWHIRYNPGANELAKKEGYETWWDCFKFHSNLYGLNTDVNLPRIGPFVLKQATSSQMISERNPYYFIVDTAGNQLPYIDRIVTNVVSMEVYQMKVISGETDLAWLNTSISNYPLYKENEQKGNYRVILWPGKHATELALWLNLNEKNPALRKIYQDIRFRRALSLAINRDAINESIFFGKAVPRQLTVLPNFPGYKEEWAKAYAQYDPDRANQLLDEMGLTKRSKDGFRLGPDGKPLLLIIEYVELEGPKGAILELVKEYWEKVGIKVLLKLEERSFFGKRMQSTEHGVKAWHTINPMMFYAADESIFPATDCIYAWDRWINTHGEKGEEPPEYVKNVYKWRDEAREQVPGSKEFIEITQKMGDLAAEKLWGIGTVGMAPQPHIVKNNLRNYPLPIEQVSPYSNGWMPLVLFEQLFFKK